MHDRFPCEAVLKDGKRLLLRRLERHDEAALNAFFQRLPTQIRRLAWQDLNSSVIHEWIQNIDYEKALPVIALDGTRVVGDATLHYREGGPLRLVGRIRWMIDPEYNGVGLGTTFGHHFIHIAKQNGLRHLSCMLATRLEEEAGRFTGRVVDPICYGAGKVALAETWANEHDVDLGESAFYTDSISDLPMLERVKEPVVINPDPRLRLLAWRRGWRVEKW